MIGSVTVSPGELPNSLKWSKIATKQPNFRKLLIYSLVELFANVAGAIYVLENPSANVSNCQKRPENGAANVSRGVFVLEMDLLALGDPFTS